MDADGHRSARVAQLLRAARQARGGRGAVAVNADDGFPGRQAAVARESQAEVVAAAVAAFAGARRRWLAPLEAEFQRVARLMESGQLSDADVLALVEDLRERLPELMGSTDTQALSDHLVRVLGTAALAGADDRLSARGD
jgi:hypothetical protein